jgi:hypothetical protein
MNTSTLVQNLLFLKMADSGNLLAPEAIALEVVEDQTHCYPHV